MAQTKLFWKEEKVGTKSWERTKILGSFWHPWLWVQPWAPKAPSLAPQAPKGLDRTCTRGAWRSGCQGTPRASGLGAKAGASRALARCLIGNFRECGGRPGAPKWMCPFMCSCCRLARRFVSGYLGSLKPNSSSSVLRWVVNLLGYFYFKKNVEYHKHNHKDKGHLNLIESYMKSNEHAEHIWIKRD